MVIWRAQDIIGKDFDAKSDVYFRSTFDEESDSLTDIHWRCENGQPIFNYRCKLDIETGPNRNHILQV